MGCVLDRNLQGEDAGYVRLRICCGVLGKKRTTEELWVVLRRGLLAEEILHPARQWVIPKVYSAGHIQIHRRRRPWTRSLESPEMPDALCAEA